MRRSACALDSWDGWKPAPSTTPTPSLFPGIPEAPQDASGAS
ncbi:hypothetical protein HMPREF9057_01717 [Actinomyces sp. oral taxon 171 str. F0337]|nr:hypothetical protein HMPREF9057_01717 [Actinomyces sp. oral taxon 171 str. F0337]